MFDAGVQPAPEADKYTLVRRAYLEMIGLPPTPEQVSEFVSSNRPEAYEDLVMRLSQSPHYGEHQARRWLDLARPAALPVAPADEVLRRTEQRSVVLQLERLMDYPMVAPRVRSGEVFLHGWHYLLEDGKVLVLDVLSGAFVPAEEPQFLEVKVRDEGEGFDPEELADPLAPENLLKSSGRGIFFMRNFMDDVELRRRPEGGMEVCMRKRLSGPHA